MAVFNAQAAQVSINMAGADAQDDVDFAAFLGASPSSYVWGTTSGFQIAALSLENDIAVNGSGVATAGTVFGLSALGPGGVMGYSVTGLAADLPAILAAPNLEAYWRAVLEGATTILMPDTFASVSGDFLTVASETIAGGADTFIGTDQVIQFLHGDAVTVASGQLTGGADAFVIATDAIVMGEVDGNAGTLIGGDDEFLWEANGVVSTSLLIGDALSSGGDTTGGDDRMTIRNTFGISGIAGDVLEITAGIVRGGDDLIVFDNGGANSIVGDVEIVNGGTVFAGADRIVGSGNNDTIRGDFRTLNAGSVIIDATFTGADRLSGGGGADVLLGQVGNDILDGGTGGDVLDGGTGTDTADYRLEGAVSVDLGTNTGGLAAVGDSYGSIERVFGSRTGNDTLTGLDGAQTLVGFGGVDRLFGLGGNDRLEGGDGRDFLTGGLGRDTLLGGAGDDRFEFKTLADSSAASADADTIVDFSAGADQIDLFSIDASSSTVGNNAFVFIGAAAFTAEGQVRAIGSGGDTLVQLNVTGTSGADMTIRLTGLVTLADTDFRL